MTTERWRMYLTPDQESVYNYSLLARTWGVTGPLVDGELRLAETVGRERMAAADGKGSTWLEAVNMDTQEER